MLTPAVLEALDPFLVELNRASARVILPLFRADHGLEDKNQGGAFDPVTAADKGAEAAIRSMIGEHHPGHGVIGEEYGEDRPEAESKSISGTVARRG
jgi:fructose-1,6-bisphosphatase/inositol monophosphatase family enzyme